MVRSHRAALARSRALCSLSLVALAVGCDADPTASDDGGLDAGAIVRVDGGPPDAFRNAYDVGAFTRIGETEAASGRASCAFGRGAMPWETIGEEYPVGDAIPIKHWFILMQENRSFDHYFGTMPGVDGLPEGGATNPGPDGETVSTFHQTAYCTSDTGHSWSSGHRQWNLGANDGFVVDNAPNGERALGYYDDTDLPYYWDLYRTFAMSDHHHSSALGPTWVNREYFLSATSFGLVQNDPVPADRLPTDDAIIFQQLERAGVTWRIYHAAVPFLWGPYPTWALSREVRAHQRDYDRFLDDLDAGDIADVTYIDPTWDFVGGVDATDEHPHANIQRGQAWVRSVLERIFASPVWQDSAVILTYDEWGGFYDHVAPPEACPPGDFPPDVTTEGDAFTRYGFRVPLVVVSPWSRPGYVSDRVTDHASVVRLLQTRYLLPAMTGRDANAWPLLDLFDFSTPTFATPPELAEAPVDADREAACNAAFPD